MTYGTTPVCDGPLQASEARCGEPQDSISVTMVDTNKCLREIIYEIMSLEELLNGVTAKGGDPPADPACLRDNARQNNQLAHGVLAALQDIRRGLA